MEEATKGGERDPARVAGEKVQLGCGTLLLMCLIVAIFSGRSEIEDVQRELRDIKASLTSVNGQVSALRALVEQRLPPTPPKSASGNPPEEE